MDAAAKRVKTAAKDAAHDGGQANDYDGMIWHGDMLIPEEVHPLDRQTSDELEAAPGPWYPRRHDNE